MIVLLLALGACTGDKQDTGSGPTYEGPTLEHTQPTDTLVDGDAVTLAVSASDPDGVSGVTLSYRRSGDRAYTDLTLDDQGDGTWTGTVQDAREPGLEYYFTGTDAGDPPASAELPEDGQDDPFSLTILVDALDLPFYEDFEPDDDETSLYELGWWTPSQEFPGSPWALGDGETGYGAVHDRGVGADNEIHDWLISPPLDFTTLSTAMVVWREEGANISAANHGLYISTTGRDPDAGDFLPVVEALPAPADGQWGAAAAVDLSDWVGEPVVFLAWSYEGAAADDWSIDDVEVRELAPDLTADLSWSPDPVHPGETATLDVTLTNLLDASASGLTATLSLPEGGGTLADDTADVGEIAAYGTAEAEFSLDLDPDVDDDQVLPLHLEVTDGQDTWSFDLDFTVGEPSTGSLTLSLDEPSSVIVTLGAGDPDDPLVETTVYSGSLGSGSHTIDADLTDWHDYLPPEPGDHRWWGRVTSSGTGDVEDLTLEVGGSSYSATVLPAINADEDTLVYVPEPPDPTLVLASTEPTDLTPGTSGAALTLTLTNAGADTSGPVTATLESADDDATVSGGEDLTLTSGIWGAGVTVLLSGPTLDVAGSHTDSTDLSLVLTLDDGVESWEIPVSVAVPWPVLRVMSVDIDDDGGDGVLDAGESADLSITLGNGGDLRTFGPLSAHLSVASGSAVPATISAADDTLSSISAGSTRDADGYALTAGAGDAGDDLDLVLDLSDGTASYEVPFSLTLGEPPWQRVSVADDPSGDNLDDYAFDFTSIAWREQGGVLSFLLSSSVPYDADTLFIEAWGESTGADYTYYRIVYQSGVGKLQGYNSGFTTIGTVDADLIGDTEIVLSVDSADMGLLLDTLDIGFAAGWCGPDDYYCDHYPDGWGYPYVSFTTADWFSLSW